MNATFVPSGMVPLSGNVGCVESLIPPLPAVNGQPVMGPVPAPVLASVSKLGLTIVWPVAVAASPPNQRSPVRQSSAREAVENKFTRTQARSAAQKDHQFA